MGCCAKFGKFPSPQACSSGWLETLRLCPSWSKMDFHRCLKIAARSKEMLTVSRMWFALGMVAAEARLHVAVPQAARSLPCLDLYERPNG